VPDAIGHRAQLENLFSDPEMAALIAAAPAPMARTLRPLCRMLGLAPPKILAPPQKPRPRRAAPVAAPEPPPPPPPPLQRPAWMNLGPDRKPWSLTRMCGSRRKT
jgi:hypothetical protein